MLRKFHVIKKIQSCYKKNIRKLIVNCASVHNVENATSKVAKITQNITVDNYKFCNELKRNRFFKYGMAIGAVSTIGSLLNNSVEEDVETNLAHLMQLAKYALESGEIERAEAILKVGLKLSEDHKVYTALPFIYDILATLAINEGRVDNAESLLVEAIERLSTLGYSDTNHNIVDFRLRLARMYSASGYKTLADIGFENCLEQQKTKIMDGDFTDKTGLLYVNILFWYGVHKMRHESFTEAKQLLNNAYNYSTKIKGLSPKQEMVILYTLGELNAELGDYEVALTSMLDAIVLGKGIGSIDLPLCYLKLGYIYQRLDIKDRANACFLEAKTQGELYGFGEVVAEAVAAMTLLGYTS